jgi:hypothetical protein
VRHEDIADDEVGLLVEHGIAGRDPVFGSLDLVAGMLEMQRQQLAHVAVVVDDQDPQHRIASPGEPTSYPRSC